MTFIPHRRAKDLQARREDGRLAGFLWVWLFVFGTFLQAESSESEGFIPSFRTGRYDEAVERARKAIDKQKNDENAHLVLLDGLLTLGRYGEAQEALTLALNQNPESLRLIWKGREVAFAVGDTNRVATLTERIRKMMADRPWGYREPANIIILGQALLEFGADPKEILDKVFGSTLKANPVPIEAFLARGSLALQKHDYALAAKIWREASEKFPDHPDVLFGLAQAVAGADPAEASAALKAALTINPHHVPSLLLLANQQIDSENDIEADKLLGEVLEVNPWNSEAWACRAVLAHLHNDRAREAQARSNALHAWAFNPSVDSTIGEKLSQKYRFEEGANHQRQALAFDPDYWPAKIRLAQDQLRLGNEASGWELAAAVSSHDAYDVQAYNLTRLHETLRRFATVTNAGLVIRMEPREAGIYGQRALDLLERARRTLTKKYEVELVAPTFIEIFTDQKDFGVRTFGMPENPGFLGVCFGRVVTANSPAANPSQPVNWEAVLWHEFCHAVTLTLTRNKMPRWLSEGISVYEEIQENASWGQHLTPRYREMILKGELTPVSRLSGAFLAPPTPEHLQFAYFEAEWVVEYIVQRYGHDQLRAILKDLADGMRIQEALTRHAAEPNQLDADFAAFAREQVGKLGPGLDWTSPPLEWADSNDPEKQLELWESAHPTNYWALRAQGERLSRQKRWGEARQVWQKLVDRQPAQFGPGSAYWPLAEACREAGDSDAEYEVLKRGAALDHEAPEAYRRLMELGFQRKDWQEVICNAERFVAVNPLVVTPYRYLAQASEKSGDVARAVSALQTGLVLDPPNPAEVEFTLARLLNQSSDPSARNHLLKSLEEAPRNREALRLLLAMSRTNVATPPAIHQP